jgi:hypothetical protein
MGFTRDDPHWIGVGHLMPAVMRRKRTWLMSSGGLQYYRAQSIQTWLTMIVHPRHRPRGVTRAIGAMLTMARAGAIRR